MLDKDEVVRNLLSRLNEVKERKEGSWRALCPGHDDHNPSLDITIGNRGLLLICRSQGCAIEEILRPLGLDVSDLLWEHRNGNAPPPLRLTARRRPKSYFVPGTLVATHLYEMEAGRPHIKVERWHHANPDRPKGYDKECLPLHWENDEWKTGIGNLARPLYCLPSLIENPTDLVIWVEGEGIVDWLRGEGILATTSLGGSSGKGFLPDVTILKGRDVFIAPDADEPGLEYAKKVREHLKSAGARTHDLKLPNWSPPKGGDLLDWRDAGHSIADLLPLLTPPRPRFHILDLGEFLNQPPLRWQFEEIMQEGTLFEIYGEPGHGKSFLGMDLLLASCCFATWCGRRIVVPGAGIYVNADGGRGFAGRVRAWIEANDHPTFNHGFHVFNDMVPLLSGPSFFEFVEQIKSQKIVPSIVLFDTYSRCIPGGDENGQEAASTVVYHLDKLRQEFGCSVGLIHHTNKEGKHERGSNVIMGAMDTTIRVAQQGTIIEVTNTKQRDGDRFQPIQFQLKPVAGTGQVVLWQAGREEFVDPARRRETRVCDYLAGHADSTQQELEQALGQGHRQITEALRTLIAEGRVVKSGMRETTGRPASTFALYRDPYGDA